VYSMVVLIWIYVFQFEDILDRWQNITGMTDSQYVTLVTVVFFVVLFIFLCQCASRNCLLFFCDY